MPNTKQIGRIALSLTLSTALVPLALAQNDEPQVFSPPSIGEETKGEPAVAETIEAETKTPQTEKSDEEEQTAGKSLFGEAKITESRRENGQVYLIELEHASGSKQYIEENDSDGKIVSDSKNIDETPNLPKWKLGSW